MGIVGDRAGRSVGEGIGAVAAEYVSGGLSLEDATKLIARRSRMPGADRPGCGTIWRSWPRPGMTSSSRSGRSRALPGSSGNRSLGTRDRRWSSRRSGAGTGASNRCDGRPLSSTPRASRSSGRGSRRRGDSSACLSYPWRRERYWLDDEEAAPRVVAPAAVIPTVAAAEGPDDLIDYLRDRTAGILGLSPDQVNLDRPLLAMGLDSLTAMELKAEIDAHLGVKLPLSVLIEGSSIRDVAGRRASIVAMPRRRRPASPGPTPAEPAEARPSHGQQMLWYAHQFARTGAAYHIAGAG